jgi:hypothetical protein
LDELSFGEVELGNESAKIVYVCSTGITEETISLRRAPEGFRFAFGGHWYSFPGHQYERESIPLSTCVPAAVFFSPASAPKSYGGVLTFVSDSADREYSLEVTGEGVRPPLPRTVFEYGRYLVGIGVAPGRYYSDPTIVRDSGGASYCGWWRLSSRNFPNGPAIGEQVYRFDPGQAIVDILPTDYAFTSDLPCQLWQPVPQIGLQSSITAGTWLVGGQVAPARHRAEAQPGCAWERLRHFQGTPDGVIERGSTDRAQALLVTIGRNDVGFATNDACGMWSRVR